MGGGDRLTTTSYSHNMRKTWKTVVSDLGLVGLSVVVDVLLPLRPAHTLL